MGPFYQHGLSLLQTRISVGWNYLSIPKLQLCNRFWMDKQFCPKLYWTGHHLSMLGLKLAHVRKRGPRLYADTAEVFELIVNRIDNDI